MNNTEERFDYNFVTINGLKIGKDVKPSEIKEFFNSLLDELLSEVGEDEERLSNKQIEDELEIFTETPFSEKSIRAYTKKIAEIITKLVANREKAKFRAIINHKKL